MQRNLSLLLFRGSTILLAAILALVEMRRLQPESMQLFLFLTGLALLTAFLRVCLRSGSLGFESVIAFPAIILFESAALAALPILFGSLLHRLYDGFRHGRMTLGAFFDAAQLTVTFYFLALFYESTMPVDPGVMVKAAAYVLLLVGFIVLTLFFDSVDRYLSRDEVETSVVDVLGAQTRVLLLVSPVVATEILLYPHYGIVGLGIAFLPVLIVAHITRRESETDEKGSQLDRRRHELSLLTESSANLLSAEGNEETIKRLIKLLGDMAKMKACAAVTWETMPEAPLAVYRFGECLPTDQAIVKWVDSSGFAQAAPKKALILEGLHRTFPLSDGPGTQIILGIQTVEVIYGVLIYETEDPVTMPETLNLFSLLVNQTALSLQDQLLRELMRGKTAQLEKQAETMSTILEVSNGLIGQYDVDAMLGRIAQAIRKSLGFEVVVFALLDSRRSEFVRRAHAGLEDIWDEVRHKHVPAAEITEFFTDDFRVSNSYFIPHSSLRKGDYDLVVKHDDGHRSDEWHSLDMLIVPLLGGETLIGYLSVREPLDRRIPTLEKIQTLEIFASQSITALQSARQYEEIKRLTFIDSLTPAFNHRYFQEALRKEVHRHERTGHSFAVAMMDIDNFKNVNDTWGHPVGDEVLKGLVEELMLNVREIDIVSRYGGEEFAIIFPEMPPERAREVANRLRLLVAAREFQTPQLSQALRITVSIGVALFPLDGLDETQIIARADAALYDAKKSGKNKVVISSGFPVPVPSGQQQS
ncbi:MAG TPA: diguanylate cyclase [Thermoanaerobaculia bacterium]|nr:diguanylate cyclase [Thermoanaerobaculia bacterium]